MKIGILGDAHAGARDGNVLIMDNQLDYLCNEFIPYLVDNNIKLVVQTGDMFDVRKHTRTDVLEEWKRRFFDRLKALGIELIIYIGNHDMVYKNKISPNSVSTNLSDYDNITIIEKVTTMEIGGKSCLIVPWICAENEEDCMNSINTSEADICLGHFEIKGAKMESSTCTDGLPLSTFKRFLMCISGHFHSMGKYENVTYVGTPTQLTWGDYGHEKGFHILDTDCMELTFIKNENDLFHKITYNETRDMDIIPLETYANKYVKVVVEHREDFKAYERWLLKMENCGTASLTIIEPYMDRNEGDSDIDLSDEDFKVESTADIIKTYVADVYPERKEPLTKMMLSLLSEAERTFK